jgi:hypothetical protein
MLLKSSLNMKTHITPKLEHADSNQKTRTVLHYPPYNPDFGFSDFNLFGALKHVVRQKRFGSEDEVTEEVIESIKFGPVQEGKGALAAC